MRMGRGDGDGGGEESQSTPGEDWSGPPIKSSLRPLSVSWGRRLHGRRSPMEDGVVLMYQTGCFCESNLRYPSPSLSLSGGELRTDECVGFRVPSPELLEVRRS